MGGGRKSGGVADGAASLVKCVDDPSLLPRVCLEGESLTRFLEPFRREIESGIASNAKLPYKFWIKNQFAVGVNEVTRVLERMPLNCKAEVSSKEQALTDLGASGTFLQAILVASDCNPRWLTKHLPTLAASRNVPIISVKDRKEGSLRLGQLIKLKTTIAIGIKARGNSLNQLIEEVLASHKTGCINA